MTDLEDRLGSLAETRLHAPAPDMDMLTRRATGLRRRRRLMEGAGAIVAGVALLAVGMTLTSVSPRQAPNVVFEQPPPPLPKGWKRTHLGPLTVDHPSGWSVQRSTDENTQEPQVVLANRPLADRDIDLAYLVRDDARFSRALPRDVVVFVVGSDYITAPPDPDGALGRAKTLPRPAGFDDDVVVRKGSVPSSILHMAAYVGPEAPARTQRVLDVVASRVRLEELDLDPGPPPPDWAVPAGGDTPDDPVFTEPWPIQVETRLPYGERLAVRTKGDCAVVTVERGDERNKMITDRRCELGPRTRHIEGVIGALSEGPPPDPGADPTTETDQHLVVARMSPEVARVRAELTDGRTAAVIINNGWALTLAPTRVFRLVALDEKGETLGTVVDP